MVIPCSATNPCPDDLICVPGRNLCAPPLPDMAGMATADLAMPPGVDMAGMMGPPDMTGLPDMAGLPDLGKPSDMALPSDMAMLGDMAMPEDMAMPVDMSMPADLAMMPPDLSMPPRDMAVPRDMTSPPPDMTPPPPGGPRVCPFGSSRWCWENPLPQPRSLNAAWGASTGDIWLVGDYGSILRYDGVDSVTQATTEDGHEYAFYGVWGRSPSEVWIVGEAGVIWYWNGSTLSKQLSGTGNILRAVWGDASTTWAVGDGGTIIRNDGTGWRTVPSGTTNPLYGIWGSAANSIWAVGAAGTACYYSGSLWTCGTEFTGSPTAYAISGTAKNDIWAVMNGAGQPIWHYDGTAWRSTSLAGVTNLTDVQAFSPTSAAATTPSGDVALYDGTTWKLAAPKPGKGGLNGLWGLGSNDYVAVGDDGQIVRVRGSTPTALLRGSKSTIVALWGSSESDYWVFTEGKIARHVQGTIATEYMLPSDPLSVAGRAADDIWVGSTAGKLLHWDGTSWTTQATMATGPINYLASVSSDRLVISSPDRVQFYDGLRFVTSETGLRYGAVWGSGPFDIWVGAGNFCGYRRFDGMKWSSGGLGSCVFGASEITSIHGSSASNVYFGLNNSSYVIRYNGSGYEAISVRNANVVYVTPTRAFFSDSYYLYERNGTTGTPTIAARFYEPVRAILAFSADVALAGGTSGLLMKRRP